MIGIYKIVSPTGRVYVGQSRDIVRRQKTYKSLTRSNNKQVRLYRSFIKYGIEAHIFDIIEECTFEELNNRERFWQDYYKVLGSGGLNCILTETDKLPRVYTIEVRAKMSRVRNERGIGKGVRHYLYGKNKTEAQKNIHSNTMKAYFKVNKHPMLDKKQTEETRTKISNTRLRMGIGKGELHYLYGKEVSQEIKDKIRQTLIKTDRKRGNSPTSKLVLDTQTGVFYESLKDAAEAISVEYKKLSSMITNKIRNKTSMIYC